MSDMNERGEFTNHDGRLMHQVSVPQNPDFAIHDGEWLKCDGCNPVRLVDVQALVPHSTEDALVALRREYDDAKAEAAAAAERFDTAKSKLQQALSEATNGAYRAELRVPGYRPMTLIYTEPWRIDSKRLQAEQPAVYVEYAKRGSQWTLAESRAKS